MSKKIVIFTEGAGADNDRRHSSAIRANGRMRFSAAGNPRVAALQECRTHFDLLPAAALAVGSDPLTLSLGSGVEVVSRASLGGCNIQMAASTDGTNAMLIPAAATGFAVPITAASKPRFGTRVRLSQITNIVFGAGFDENITSPITTATAGAGAGFLFDSAGKDAGIAAALGAPALANWILTEKVLGVDTYKNSGVPVLTGVDYELVVEIGVDLIPVYFINSVQVGVGASAMTLNAVLSFVIGCQANGVRQGDFDIRYVAVERE